MLFIRIKRSLLLVMLSTAVLFTAQNIVPIDDAYLYTDSLYSTIYLHRNGQTQEVLSGPGFGHFSVSPDHKMIGFKYREAPGGMESPAVYDIETKTLNILHDAVWCAGQVSFSDNLDICYTIDQDLYVVNDNEKKVYDLGCYANIAPISPNGNWVVFNDDLDQLWLLNLQNATRIQITSGSYSSFFPQWSHDSRYISFRRLDGSIAIYDRINEVLQELGKAGAFQWSKNSNNFTFTKVFLNDQNEMINTDILESTIDGDILFSSNTPESNEFASFYLQDGSLAYLRDSQITSLKGQNILAKNTLSKITLSIDPKVYSVNASSEDSFLDVPYIHQVYDTPGQRGYSSCAPTTAAMVMAYYGILPKWPFVSGFGNVSDYGAYVHERYYYNGSYYDYTYTDCNSTSSYCYTCYGGMGFMWTSGSPNSNMLNYYTRHGMTGNQKWDVNWSTVSGEIDKGKPYSICNFLSSSGHLVVGLGRVTNGQRTVFVNDPYGDRNLSSWPNYYGKGVSYDWPGYNHGHASLNYANSSYTTMPWCIATSFTAAAIEDSVVDDKQFDNGFYIKAEGNTVPMRYYHSSNTGYQGHHWWTYTEANESDICYVTWTPHIDSSAYYEIFAYIPAAATATTAKYRVHHTAGELAVIIDQNAHSDEWVSLGKFMFRNDGSDYVYLGDSTGVGSQKIAFDAMKWRAVEVQNLDFEAEYTQGYPGFDVTFWVNSPISEGNYTYTWDFGDGEIAYGDTVIHAFSDTGSFTISLTAETGGIHATEVKNAYINIESNEGEIALVYPAQHEIIATNKPVLTWLKSLVKATSPGYTGVYLSLTPDFVDTLFQVVTTESYYSIPIVLPENKNIYWRIFYPPSNAWGSDVQGIESLSSMHSKVGVFTVNAKNSLPMDFALQSPEQGSIQQTFTPTFIWDQAVDRDPGDSLIYKLFLGVSEDSMRCVYEGSDHEYTMENELLENGHYLWYVEAIDHAQAIKRSNEKRNVFINTYNEAPSKPRQIAPNHNSYQTTRYPYLEWTASEDPDPGDSVTYKVFYWIKGTSSVYVINSDVCYHDERRFRDEREYEWTVAAIDMHDVYTYSDTLTFYIDSELDVLDVPQEYALKGNYPNPFNPMTKIMYSIPEQVNVEIKIYELSGKEVMTLTNEIQQAGHYSLLFDASHFSSGIYIYRMIAGEFVQSSKMLLLK